MTDSPRPKQAGRDVVCARPEDPPCGHGYSLHPEGGRCVACRCRGFLWVDPYPFGAFQRV